MVPNEITLDLSAQVAAFMSRALKGSSETKSKIEEVLFAWAASVFSEEQNAFVEETMSKDPSNIPRIGAGKLLFALSEPSAAIDTLPITFNKNDLEKLRKELKTELDFLVMVLSQDSKHIREDYAVDGTPEDDEVLQEELLNSESRFRAQIQIGQQLLRTVNLQLPS